MATSPSNVRPGSSNGRDPSVRRSHIPAQRRRKYRPSLHSSEAGKRFGHSAGSLSLTDDFSCRLIRLPLRCGMKDEDARVIDCVYKLTASVARA
jgi:hypothetical protein